MSGVKAKLKVVLQADEAVVAESEDAGLWQRVLLAINKGSDEDSLVQVAPRERQDNPPREEADFLSANASEVARFARLVGVSVDDIQGACAPSKTSPYLTIDMHCWETMKEQTPARGIGSISPMAVAATLLALWMQAAKLGAATQGEAQKVLATINLRDANAGRSIQASEWLQGRAGGVIVLNPARAKRALAIAKAFCTQDWRSDLTWKGGTAQ